MNVGETVVNKRMHTDSKKQNDKEREAAFFAAGDARR